MVKKLIGRGAFAGALAGLAAFAFARIFAEPIIQQAINYESARDAAQATLDRATGVATPGGGPDIFSRAVQMDVGVGAGLVLFGAAMGALVAVAYAIAVGRVGRVRPLQLALVVPAFLFVGVYLVPFMKYPANPPAIGHAATIRDRGALYLILVSCSCLFLFLAVYFGQKLHKRCSLYTSVLVVGAGYLLVMGVVFAVLPEVGHLRYNQITFGSYATETPQPLVGRQGNIVFPGFPADVLAKFRIFSIVNQVILWGGIALIFAPLAQRLLDPAAAQAARQARFVEDHAPVAV